MASQKKDVALLVHSCDRYALLYEGFEFFFSKHWDFNTDCNYYFAAEEKAVSINGFENIRSGKGEWADRLAYLLKNCITEPYVLYFQEDMWLNKPVDPLFFNQLFKTALAEKWQQVKLHSSSIYETIPTGTFIEGFQVARLDNAKSDYLMSHQVTLWDKAFLLEQLHKNEHPWRNERKATKRLRKLNPKILHIDYFAENGNAPINDNMAHAVSSSYDTISINGMLNDKTKAFIAELHQAGEAQKAYATTLEHHYQNSLTHDGKPRPHKVDIFKRIKNWWLSIFKVR